MVILGFGGFFGWIFFSYYYYFLNQTFIVLALCPFLWHLLLEDRRSPVLKPRPVRDRHWEPVFCKNSSLLPVFFTQLKEAHFVPCPLQQGLDPIAVDAHMFPIVLSKLFVTIIVSAGLH